MGFLNYLNVISDKNDMPGVCPQLLYFKFCSKKIDYIVLLYPEWWNYVAVVAVADRQKWIYCC